MCPDGTLRKTVLASVVSSLFAHPSCLAVFGCLLGHTRIWQEMEDSDLVALIRHLGYDECLPVVAAPRSSTPSMRSSPSCSRSASPTRPCPTRPSASPPTRRRRCPCATATRLRPYAADPALDPAKLTDISLAIVGWLRCLVDVDDRGEAFTSSPGPLLAELQVHLAPLSLGATDAATIHGCVGPILSNAETFTVNLYDLGLGEKVKRMLAEELAGPGTVRATIEKYA